VEFKCLPWEAPGGSDDCEKCNEDPLKPCSPYRCYSLGQNCEIENMNTENPICYGVASNDKTPPLITFGKVDEEKYKVIHSSRGVDIKTIYDSCVDEYTIVPFTFDTDEYARCKVSLNESDYEDMGEYFANDNSFLKEHVGMYIMPNLDEFFSYDDGKLNGKLDSMQLHIRCEDTHGNINPVSYKINFCIKNGPDLTAPLVYATSPAEKSYLIYNQTSTEAIFYLSEPAECKFSKTADISYNLMTNKMNCSTSMSNVSIYGWPCETTLTDLTSAENNIYIKCKDQPWLDLPENSKLITEEKRMRNTNTQDYIYTLYKTQTPLEIYYIEPKPNQTVYTGTTETSINLVAKTQGGAGNFGFAECSYNFDNGWEGKFFDTGYSTHTQKDLSLSEGIYNVTINCKDDFGNTAETKTNFKIELDDDYPIVTRAYHEAQSLVVITNEKATCYYDTTTCLFPFSAEKQMGSAKEGTFHYVEWVAGQKYYIKCKDIWGNFNNGCNIKITAEN
jgi:hypothetical protein